MSSCPGTGLGYEIRFAYDNLDNNIMYPLILLILLLAVAVNISLDHWERLLEGGDKVAPDASDSLRQSVPVSCGWAARHLAGRLLVGRPQCLAASI